MIDLRPFVREDFQTLIRWTPSREFLMQWAGPNFTWPLDNAQLENRLWQTLRPNPNLTAFTALNSDTGEAVGHVELGAIDRANRSASVACVLVGPAERGRGIGSEMVQQVLRVAFEQMQLHRVQLHVFDFNEGAIACYEKCGFHKEGLLREVRCVGDKYWSLYVMGILEDEWRRGVGSAT